MNRAFHRHNLFDNKSPTVNCIHVGAKIIFVMNGWASAAGGIQTVNREIATEFARDRGAPEVIALTPFANENEKIDALARNVRLITGGKEGDWARCLTAPEIEALNPDEVIAIIGHSYFSGDEALLLRERRFPGALGVQFVHTSALDIEALKEHKAETYVAQREAKHATEMEIARRADLVCAIGPRLYRAVHDGLIAERRGIETMTQLDCGLADLPIEGKVTPLERSLLCIGRTESLGVKGLDVFAYCAAYLTKLLAEHPSTKNETPPRFVVRGAQGNGEELQAKLQAYADRVFPNVRFLVRPYTTDVNELTEDYLRSSIVVMPSRQEGFGLVACEALSLGVPVLVSRSSGFAELLGKVAHENAISKAPWIVDMDDDAKVAGKRFADAALEILTANPSILPYLARLRAHALQSFSWRNGAQQLRAAIDQLAEQRALRSASGDTGSANTIVSKTLSPARRQLESIPGVIGSAEESYLVALVAKGSLPNLPAQIDGVKVIKREVEDITPTASYAEGVNRGFFVDGVRLAAVGPLLAGRDGRLFTLTAAHAVPRDERPIYVGRGKNLIPVAVDRIDRIEDWALLELPSASHTLREVLWREPRSDEIVSVETPLGVFAGRVGAVAMNVHVSAHRDGGDLRYTDLFEIRFEGGPALGGVSGSLVVSAAGEPLGMVIAAFSGETSQALLAKPLAPVVRALQLSYAKLSDARPARVGVLAGSLDAMHAILGHADFVESGRRGPVARSGDTTLFVESLRRPGNISAAIAASSMLARQQPDAIIVVGVCGGLRPDVQRQGDVVVSSEVIYYEPGAFTDPTIASGVRIVSRTPGWLTADAIGLSERLLEDGSRLAKIHTGAIASGEKTIFDGEEFGRFLGAWQRDVIAVDMESAGVAEAIAQTSDGTPLIVVRGISDFTGPQKDDRGRVLALQNAARVALQIAKRMSEQGGSGW